MDAFRQHHRDLDRAAAPYYSSGRAGRPERLWSPRELPEALSPTPLVRMSLRGCGSARCRIYLRSLDLTVRAAAIWCGTFPIGRVPDLVDRGLTREFVFVAPSLVIAKVAHEILSAHLDDERIPHGGRLEYVHAGSAETGIDASDVVFGLNGRISLSQRCWANHLLHSVRAPWQTRGKCLVLP